MDTKETNSEENAQKTIYEEVISLATTDKSTEEKGFRTSYFKEQFLFTIEQLERTEILRRAEIRHYRENLKERRGPLSALQSYAAEYSHATDIHGMWYLSEKRSLCEKIFWTLVVISCLSLCFAIITRILIDYKDKSVLINFATAEIPIYQIAFPAITICPESKFLKNIFTEREIQEIFMEKQRIPPRLSVAAQYWYISCTPEGKEVEDLKHGNETLKGDELFEVIDQVKRSVEEVMVHCEFFGKKYNCSDLFFPTFTNEGICYTFNLITREDIFTDEAYHHGNFYKSKPTDGWRRNFLSYRANKIHTYPTRALLSGARNALKVILKSDNPNYDFICQTENNGYKVVIHSPLAAPNCVRDHLLVPMNKFVSVVITPHSLSAGGRVLRMSPSTRLCYVQNEKYLKHFKIYYRHNCHLQCLTEFMLEKCGCVQFYMTRNKDTPICGARSKVCSKSAEEKWEHLELQSQLKNSSFCDCKPLCTETMYNTEISQSVWNWKQYYEHQWGDEVEEEKKRINITSEEMSMLNIYLKSPTFQSLMRYEWHGLPELISLIGGLLTFFCGMSIISLVELLYYSSLRVLCNRIKHGKWWGPQRHRRKRNRE